MPLVENDIDIVEFPFKGAFYTSEIDASKPLYEQEETEVLVLPTICDIQPIGKERSNTLLGAGYTIYFPLELNSNSTGTVDKYQDIKIRRGMTFRGKFYGEDIEGVVEFIDASQLGACSCDIKVVTENE